MSISAFATTAAAESGEDQASAETAAVAANLMLTVVSPTMVPRDLTPEEKAAALKKKASPKKYKNPRASKLYAKGETVENEAPCPYKPKPTLIPPLCSRRTRRWTTRVTPSQPTPTI